MWMLSLKRSTTWPPLICFFTIRVRNMEIFITLVTPSFLHPNFGTIPKLLILIHAINLSNVNLNFPMRILFLHLQILNVPLNLQLLQTRRCPPWDPPQASAQPLLHFTSHLSAFLLLLSPSLHCHSLHIPHSFPQFKDSFPLHLHRLSWHLQPQPRALPSLSLTPSSTPAPPTSIYLIIRVIWPAISSSPVDQIKPK